MALELKIRGYHTIIHKGSYSSFKAIAPVFSKRHNDLERPINHVPIYGYAVESSSLDYCQHLDFHPDNIFSDKHIECYLILTRFTKQHKNDTIIYLAQSKDLGLIHDSNADDISSNTENSRFLRFFVHVAELIQLESSWYKSESRQREEFAC